jgi:hypothetical protein
MKKLSYLFAALLIAFNFSCQKEEETNNDCCANNEAMQMRMAMQQDGYTEIEVDPIEKIDCYFEEWDKTIITPVSGLLEYYDQDNIWVASISFGDGACDQWATKTWDINIFPESPEGVSQFSLFE